MPVFTLLSLPSFFVYISPIYFLAVFLDYDALDAERGQTPPQRPCRLLGPREAP